MGVPFQKVNYNNQDPAPNPAGHTVNYSAMGATPTQATPTSVPPGLQQEITAQQPGDDITKITFDIQGASYAGPMTWQSSKVIARLDVTAKQNTLTAIGLDAHGHPVDGAWV